MYCYATKEWHSPCSILTDDQTRLRGDYNVVFDNFDNPEYVAPEYKFEPLDDNDVPF
ncbi:MAG: hypothetical protein ABFD07_06970 [Methanobacterium sp.]